MKKRVIALLFSLVITDAQGIAPGRISPEISKIISRGAPVRRVGTEIGSGIAQAQIQEQLSERIVAIEQWIQQAEQLSTELKRCLSKRCRTDLKVQIPIHLREAARILKIIYEPLIEKVVPPAENPFE